MTTANTKFIAIGSNGRSLTIWGSGVTADEAAADVLNWCDVDDVPETVELEVPADFCVNDVDVERRFDLVVVSTRNGLRISCPAFGTESSTL